ncbi:MAG: alpha/beta hydrolase [Gammaproteobacteria bacterium]|nr:alpha/beta hydrolase [Gammaproteobacteria bacterium]
MSIALIELTVRGETRTAISVGSGENICYMVGPSSFYLKSFINAGLAEDFTFISCDPMWSVNDDVSMGRSIESISLEDVVTLDHDIVQAIKHRFNCQKIGMIGLSAPACVAAQYAKQYPEDIAWLKLGGMPLQLIDASFASSDDPFEKNATADRVQKFHSEQVKKTAPSFYTYMTNALGTSVEHAEWLAETVALYHKAFLRDTVQCRYAFFEHWKTNFLGQEMNQAFRQHFFSTLLPQINAFSNVTTIDPTIPIQIFNGCEDYITPLAPEIADELSKISSIELVHYPTSGHFFYIDNPIQFRTDMRRATLTSKNGS